MERDKRNFDGAVDLEFRRLLFYWQADPESDDMRNRFVSLLRRAEHTGRGLEVRIKDEVLGTTEGRNSISRQDLIRYSRHEGYNFVFRFKPKKGPEGSVRIDVKDIRPQNAKDGILSKYNLVLEAKSESGWRTFAIFMPHEIESLSLR